MNEVSVRIDCLQLTNSRLATGRIEIAEFVQLRAPARLSRWQIDTRSFGRAAKAAHGRVRRT
jgi:hypothetical protein